MILAGDIGGTKINLGFVEKTTSGLVLRENRNYSSRNYGGLADVISRFLSEFPGVVDSAAFGVPGPVIDGRCETTNLRWVVDGSELSDSLRLSKVGLLNDLAAMAYGVLELKDSSKVSLSDGYPVEHGNIAVIAAGTGLGEAGLVWDGKRYRALSSEGGHTDFGPRTPVEDELLKFLRTRFGRVSYERLVSGPGLQNIYDFFRSRSPRAEPEWLRREITEGNPSAAISQAALDRRDEVCVETLEAFASAYGAEAGNLALKYLATGGVYVGGGIAPKILPLLRQGSFMNSFREKGRYRGLLERIPVHVLLDDRAALLGAAHYATMLSE
jgi:glucokinase